MMTKLDARMLVVEAKDQETSTALGYMVTEIALLIWEVYGRWQSLTTTNCPDSRPFCRFFPSWHVLEHTLPLQTKTKALFKFCIPYTHFHPFSHAYLSAIPCSSTSTSPVTLQLSSTEGQVNFPDCRPPVSKSFALLSFQRHLKICPFSNISDTAKIVWDRQDRKRRA